MSRKWVMHQSSCSSRAASLATYSESYNLDTCATLRATLATSPVALDSCDAVMHATATAAVTRMTGALRRRMTVVLVDASRVRDRRTCPRNHAPSSARHPGCRCDRDARLTQRRRATSAGGSHRHRHRRRRHRHRHHSRRARRRVEATPRPSECRASLCAAEMDSRMATMTTSLM